MKYTVIDKFDMIFFVQRGEGYGFSIWKFCIKSKYILDLNDIDIVFDEFFQVSYFKCLYIVEALEGR